MDIEQCVGHIIDVTDINNFLPLHTFYTNLPFLFSLIRNITTNSHVFHKINRYR